MNLKNKKTGEIAEIRIYKTDKFGYTDEFSSVEGENSLAELNEEWEDAPEEPKEWWYIDIHGPHNVIKNDKYYQVVKEASKEIGNYFETKEEAEKAVEKLKAWRRLKDKGFRFDVVPALGHCDDEKFDISIIATMPAKWWYNDKVVDDIHYVFGGGE